MTNILLQHTKTVVPNGNPFVDTKISLNDVSFINILDAQFKQIDNIIEIRNFLYKKAIYNVIHNLSDYHKYIILLDPNLAKEIYAKIRNKASA